MAWPAFAGAKRPFEPGKAFEALESEFNSGHPVPAGCSRWVSINCPFIGSSWVCAGFRGTAAAYPPSLVGAAVWRRRDRRWFYRRVRRSPRRTRRRLQPFPSARCGYGGARQTDAEVLLRVAARGDDRQDQRLGVRPGGGGPGAESVRGPGRIAAMIFRHMLSGLIPWTAPP